MKTATVLALFLATATAFNAPQFATRAVGAKKVAAAASKPPPESKGYPSFAAAAQNFSLGKISGGGNKAIEPVFIHPTINTAPPPSYDYKEAAKARLAKKKTEFVYEDGLTELERKQRATIPAFLTGSAKSNPDVTAIQEVELQELPFGLDSDRFQLLFIATFGLFTLVGCLSGSVQL